MCNAYATYSRWRQARGKMKKGGVLDLEMSARAVLTDWVQGKIPYCTKPPQVADDDQQKSPVAEKEPCISKRAL